MLQKDCLRCCKGMICDVVMGDLIRSSFSSPVMSNLLFADVASSTYFISYCDLLNNSELF